MQEPSTVIAIPIKNEEARLGLCLGALVGQAADFDSLLLLLNNCTDGSLEICEQYSSRFRDLHIVQCSLPGSFASAGEARRMALDRAAEIAGNGVILTTDADAVPGVRWVRNNLRALESGVDVVCGVAKLDAQDAAVIPASIRIDEKNEARLLSIQDEIAALVDPDPADPWPRHQHHSGASIALRAAILRKSGGAPHVAIGEDRALIEKLQLMDAKVRHAPEVIVQVSGRLEGRAEGGMAATLKRRIQHRDILTDERVEPTVDAYRRVLAKAQLRAAIFGQADVALLAEDLLIGPAAVRRALQASYLGTAWAELQRLSPVLQRRRVAFSDLRREIGQAAVLRCQLRQELSPAILHRLRDNEGKLSSGENAH